MMKSTSSVCVAAPRLAAAVLAAVPVAFLAAPAAIASATLTHPCAVVLEADAPAPEADSVPIYFKPGSADLSGEAKELLDRLADEAAPEASASPRVVKVEKDVREATPARSLVTARALAVERYLLRIGVDAEDIDRGACKNGRFSPDNRSRIERRRAIVIIDS